MTGHTKINATATILRVAGDLFFVYWPVVRTWVSGEVRFAFRGAQARRDDFRLVSPLFILIEAYAAADVFLFLYLCGRAKRFMRMNPVFGSFLLFAASYKYYASWGGEKKRKRYAFKDWLTVNLLFFLYYLPGHNYYFSIIILSVVAW